MWFQAPKNGAHHSGEALSFFYVAVSLYEKRRLFYFVKESFVLAFFNL